MSWWLIILKGFVAIGALCSLLFVYLQKYKIKAWCFWCLLSALTTWTMALIILWAL